MSECDIYQSYMQSIARFPVLDEAEIRELIAQAQNGSESAKRKIINHNLKLVAKIARRYEKSDSQKLMDLISEGNLGLFRAIEKFDLAATAEGTGKNIKFNTYAYRWIQFRIEQYFSGAIQAAYCPVHMRKLARKIGNIETRLEDENFQGSILTEIHRILKSAGEDISMSEISSLREVNKSSLSVDYTNEEEGESNLNHLLTDNVELESSENIKDLSRWVQIKIEALPENQKRAIKSYYGAGEVDGTTMKSVGEEMGYTPQRAQQIVSEALKSLKSMATRENIDFSMVLS